MCIVDMRLITVKQKQVEHKITGENNGDQLSVLIIMYYLNVYILQKVLIKHAI